MSIETRRTLSYFEGPRLPFQGPIKSLASPAALNSGNIFPLAQLSRLSSCEIKIGPLTCREWDQHLQKYFASCWQASPPMQIQFPGGLVQFMASDKSALPLGGGSPKEKIVASLQQEFMGKFAGKVSRLTGIPFDQSSASSLIFLELKELAVKSDLRRRAAPQAGIDDLLKKCNTFLSMVSKRFPPGIFVA
jgi:hypothetical protein